MLLNQAAVARPLHRGAAGPYRRGREQWTMWGFSGLRTFQHILSPLPLTSQGRGMWPEIMRLDILGIYQLKTKCLV